MTEQLMQAIRFHQYGGPEQLLLEEIAIPVPADGEVLIRIHAAGILPIDWKIRQGYVRMPITFPHIPGTSFAGVVVGLGAGVNSFQLGQAVFGRSTQGTYAEYTVVPVQSLALKPASMSFEQAATVTGGATTAWQAIVKEAAVKAGDRVLIHGAAGGVGLFAVQFAKWKGAYVIGTSSPANSGFLLSIGADEVIDYTSSQFEDQALGMDIILDTIGGDTLERSWQLVNRGGILISIVAQPAEEKAEAAGIRAVKPTALATNDDLAAIAQLIGDGQVKAIVAHAFPLAEAAQAHALSQKGHGRGRIVLQIKEATI